VSGAILATGVGLRHVTDPTGWLEFVTDNHGRAAARQMAVRVEAGEIVLAEARAFIDFTDGVEEYRILGPIMSSPREIEVGPDPTSRLIEIANETREEAYLLVGDVRIHGVSATRWEAYAAPSRIELDEALSALLDSVRP